MYGINHLMEYATIVDHVKITELAIPSKTLSHEKPQTMATCRHIAIAN